VADSGFPGTEPAFSSQVQTRLRRRHAATAGEPQLVAVASPIAGAVGVRHVASRVGKAIPITETNLVLVLLPHSPSAGKADILRISGRGEGCKGRAVPAQNVARIAMDPLLANDDVFTVIAACARICE